MTKQPKHHHEARLLYHRQGEMVRLTLTSLTNHELREVLVGLWARLEPADREDHIAELRSYNTDSTSWLSDLASTIARAVSGGTKPFDLARARRMEHSDLPKGGSQ